MIENIVEHIAFSLGKDPLEIRMENLLHGSEMNSILTEFVKSVGTNCKVIINTRKPIFLNFTFAF